MSEIGFFTNSLWLSAIVVSTIIPFVIAAVPWAQSVFGLTADVLTEWPTFALTSLTPVTVVAVTKLFTRRFAYANLWIHVSIANGLRRFSRVR